MELIHFLTELLVWYIKLLKSTLPVVQLAAFTFGTLAVSAAVLYAVYVRRGRCHDVC
jgi:hypothetical protein